MSYYVCKGAKLECSEGSAPSYLGVARPDVSLCGQPMANIMDYSLGVNIAPFGLCKSLANPQVASATAMNNGVLQRMPCAPQIPLPWAGGENNVSVNGQPALLDTGTCKCAWAGSVEIKDAGQNVVSNGVQGSPKIETGTTKTETVAGQQSAGGDAGTIDDDGKKDVDNSNQTSQEGEADVAVAGETASGEDSTTKAEACVCKTYNLIWGNKVNCEFRKKVIGISKELWPKDYLNMANYFMATFAWESGGTFKAGVPNQANSGGTGLIQFMPKTAKSLLSVKEVTIEYTEEFWGKKLKRVKEFAEMTEVVQLDYVKKYFEELKGKKLEFVDFYLHILFPASSGRENHIVFAESLNKLTTRLNESEELRTLRVKAYSQNFGLDSNKDGVVWKDEIKEKVQKYVTQGKNNMATVFECR